MVVYGILAFYIVLGLGFVITEFVENRKQNKDV
jgi:hypothetical protein